MSVELPRGREQLTSLVQASGDTITVDSAVRALGLDRQKAAKTLARWREQGWLRRVARGVYVAASIDTLNKTDVLPDPWILVPTLFGVQSYIAGRTAAEHWDLTEQIFRDVVVLTTLPSRTRSVEIQGATFTAYRMTPETFFGTKTVWRGQTKINVSDIHRTIVDMLLMPEIGAGVQHVNDCLRRYVTRSDADLATVVAYGDKIGNSVLFKRLGFLLERIAGTERFVDACRTRIKSGLSPLDPSNKMTRIDTKWNLRVPRGWRD